MAPRHSEGSVDYDVKRYSLSDKVVLITGAGRGLGAATATALTQRGARVVIADIDLLTARSVVAALPTGLGTIRALHPDQVSGSVRQRGRSRQYGVGHDGVGDR